MKHRDLIIAAMDGKPFQVRIPSGPWYPWNVRSVLEHFSKFPNGCEQWEYRIKPEPVPDKVFQTVAHFHEKGKDNCPMLMAARQIKLTWKTDDNGVVTEHVEIVK